MKNIRMRERGFIQGVIIFALALIAIVVATLSSGSSDNSEAISKEQANAFAGEILNVGARMQEGYFRGQVDGRTGYDTSVDPLTANSVIVMLGSTVNTSSGQWALASYSKFPAVFDADAYAGGKTGSWSTDYQSIASKGAIIIKHTKFRGSVCDAINKKLSIAANGLYASSGDTDYKNVASNNGFLGATAGATRIEGCYGWTPKDGGTYFKVLQYGISAGD